MGGRSFLDAHGGGRATKKSQDWALLRRKDLVIDGLQGVRGRTRHPGFLVTGWKATPLLKTEERVL